MLQAQLVKEANKQYKKDKEIILVSGKANNLITDLKNYPHAFVLACAMDRQINADRAWKIPYEIMQSLGTFDIDALYKTKLSTYKNIFNQKKLHRFNDVMANIFYNAVHKIVDDYNGDASNIWNNNPSSATIVSRFLEFDGIGIKIATMATNILSKEFKIKMADYYSIDISPDIHVRRVFKRMGFIDDMNDTDKIIYKARSINPKFPGIIDSVCWELGRSVCRPKKPKCEECMFKKSCPQKISDND